MMDALLLDRLRSLGVEDGRIRFLHDRMLGGNPDRATTARRTVGRLVEGRAGIQANGHGICAEMPLAHGIHWMSDGVRVSGTGLPETILQALPGRPLMEAVEFQGAENRVITGASVGSDGSTRLEVDPYLVPPPRKGHVFKRMRYEREHLTETWERHVATGDGCDIPPDLPVLLMLVGAIAAFTVAIGVIAVFGSDHKLVILGPIVAAIGILMCLTSEPKDTPGREQGFEQEVAEMRRRQGW